MFRRQEILKNLSASARCVLPSSRTACTTGPGSAVYIQVSCDVDSVNSVCVCVCVFVCVCAVLVVVDKHAFFMTMIHGFCFHVMGYVHQWKNDS